MVANAPTLPRCTQPQETSVSGACVLVRAVCMSLPCSCIRASGDSVSVCVVQCIADTAEGSALRR
jgi:hypothetical protein